MNSVLAAAEDSAPSMAKGREVVAAATAPARRSSRKANTSLSRRRSSLKPAAMACPPPLVRSPSCTASLTTRPRSTVAIELGDAPSDETDQALVPPIDAEPDERAPQVEGPVGEREGFCEHALLDRFTLAVERFELCGDGARLALVVAGEQLGAKA